MRLLIPEVFQKADTAKTKEEKIKILRDNDSQPLRAMLYLNFNPDTKWNLPDGEPPFKKEREVPAGLSETTLYRETRRLYIWTQETNLPKSKREKLFIELLEGVQWTEAEMLCAVKDKRLQKLYKSLKEPLVREAFPGLLPAPVKEEKVPLE
jgi:hypothetical protein